MYCHQRNILNWMRNVGWKRWMWKKKYTKLSARIANKSCLFVGLFLAQPPPSFAIAIAATFTAAIYTQNETHSKKIWKIFNIGTDVLLPTTTHNNKLTPRNTLPFHCVRRHSKWMNECRNGKMNKCSTTLYNMCKRFKLARARSRPLMCTFFLSHIQLKIYIHNS